MIIREIPVRTYADAKAILDSCYESDRSSVWAKGKRPNHVSGGMITAQYKSVEGVVHVNYSGSSESELNNWLNLTSQEA